MGQSSPRIALCIMAKAPEPGQVKTRLCPPLSTADATRLYRAFLRDKIGLQVTQLVPWYDVDTGSDLARLVAELDGSGEDAAPRHTRRLLREAGRIFVSSGRI